VQDAEALRDEEQIPDRVEERDRALDRGRRHRLSLDGGELVTQLGHALLELVTALVDTPARVLLRICGWRVSYRRIGRRLHLSRL
jgi:hypothetical protein